jgi:hypothetical protein
VVVGWQQQGAGTTWVEWSLDGAAWQASPALARGTGAHEQIVAGCPYGVEVQLRVAWDPDAASQPVHQWTAPLPAGLPALELLVSESDAWDPSVGWFLASIDEPNDDGQPVAFWSFVFDRAGRIVWAWQTPDLLSTAHPRVAAAGDALLLDYNSFYSLFDGGAASQVVSLGLDGSEIQRWDTPGLHHPFTQRDDGALAWPALAGDHDQLWLLPPGGEPEPIWSCADLHAELEVDQRCEANTVAWHQPSERFLLSFYSTEAVVQIDPVSGATERVFGHLPGAWAFEPEDAAFHWQHGVHYSLDGTLLLSARVGPEQDETVVREYALDSDALVLEQVASFGVGAGLYGDRLGEAHRLPGGNTLHNLGTAARLREYDPTGRVVWDLALSPGSWLGRSTPIADLYALLP